MKRIFSLMMAVLMIASVFAVGSYAEEGNGMSVVEVEALAFAAQPTFDGVITEAKTVKILRMILVKNVVILISYSPL